MPIEVVNKLKFWLTHLEFVGHASSGNAPLISEISAHWHSQYFRGKLSLTNTGELCGNSISRNRK